MSKKKKEILKSFEEMELPEEFISEVNSLMSKAEEMNQEYVKKIEEIDERTESAKAEALSEYHDSIEQSEKSSSKKKCFFLVGAIVIIVGIIAGMFAFKD